MMLASPAFARSSDDRSSVGGNITIPAGETAADVACAFCSVKVHGEVNGDVAVLFGSVTVDPGRKISGDVAVLGGDLTLGEGASAEGDVAILAGSARLARGASIAGDKSVMPGRGWLLVLFAPLLILIGVIWLIAWLVRRNRYPPAQYPPPSYPAGRRF